MRLIKKEAYSVKIKYNEDKIPDITNFKTILNP